MIENAADALRRLNAESYAITEDDDALTPFFPLMLDLDAEPAEAFYIASIYYDAFGE